MYTVGATNLIVSLLFINKLYIYIYMLLNQSVRQEIDRPIKEKKTRSWQVFDVPLKMPKPESVDQLRTISQ